VDDWRSQLPHDPVPMLLDSGSEAIRFFVKRDLLGEKADGKRLWELYGARKLIAKQRADGSWKYNGKPKMFEPAYHTLQTYRTLGDLVEKYAFDSRHPAVIKAVDFILSSQSEEGDIRGIYGPQYSPNYTAGMMEMAIKAGYIDDARVTKAMDWLFGMRQDDGGWAFPLRTAGVRYSDAMSMGPIEPVRSRPFSHLATGMVLRAFAAHPRWRKNKEIIRAGGLLVGRFFRPDKYPDRRAASYWENTSFPFWWVDILSSLDTVSRLGIGKERSEVVKGLEWLASRQKVSGHFNVGLLAGAREPHLDDWIALAASRVFKRLC
jgi:hypothetical protein